MDPRLTIPRLSTFFKRRGWIYQIAVILTGAVEHSMETLGKVKRELDWK